MLQTSNSNSHQCHSHNHFDRFFWKFGNETKTRSPDHSILSFRFSPCPFSGKSKSVAGIGMQRNMLSHFIQYNKRSTQRVHERKSISVVGDRKDRETCVSTVNEWSFFPSFFSSSLFPLQFLLSLSFFPLTHEESCRRQQKYKYCVLFCDCTERLAFGILTICLSVCLFVPEPSWSLSSNLYLFRIFSKKRLQRQ